MGYKKQFIINKLKNSKNFYGVRNVGQTVTNWETGKIKPPRAVFICLQLFSKRLDFLGADWSGFRIGENYIESPDGLYLRANEIRAAKYALDALDIDRIKAQKLGKIQALKEELKQDEKLVFFDVAKNALKNKK